MPYTTEQLKFANRTGFDAMLALCKVPLEQRAELWRRYKELETEVMKYEALA